MNAPVLLLIEDDRDQVDVVARAFDRAKLAVELRIARDGQAALDALGLEDTPGAGAPLPRVVFLDLKLPRLDGWEVLRRLRASPRTARLPVVVMSASARSEDIRRSYELGANSYLVKRLDPRGPASDVVEAARYCIEMNQVSHEPEWFAW